ncbi:helix-turn-helix domain-containing protein [Microscilla marina]|nr:helix-turn-helix transcriptional regulator [Microscilla marina]
MDSNFHERFSKLLEKLGYRSAAQLADKMGQAPTKIRGYARGANKPGLEFLEALSQIHPEINFDYLITGIGTLLHQDTKELDMKLLQSIIESKDKQIEGYQRTLEGLQEENDKLVRLAKNRNKKA